MASPNPFAPIPGSTVSLSVTASSSNAAITQGYQVLLTNLGTNKCYVRTGAGAVSATTADMPILNGQSRVISINPEHTHVAAICDATESCTLKVTTGRGEN